MEFVISKVALSVCALMVVSVLGSSVGTVFEQDIRGELMDILTAFDRLLLSLSSSRGECSASFEVPFLSDGCAVCQRVGYGLLIVDAGNGRASMEPSVPVHTWFSRPSVLNSTEIEELDHESAACVAKSGERIDISIELVVVDDEPTLTAFACLRSSSPVP